MPGARTRVKPEPAIEPSASDEASQLEIHLQRQLEEDIARYNLYLLGHHLIIYSTYAWDSGAYHLNTLYANIIHHR